MKKSGFTLIELLVVIAIIGLLASIVLTSLSTARTKSRDAAIKSQMEQVRKQAALFFTNRGSYTHTGGAGQEDSLAECNADLVNTVFDDALTDGIGVMMNGVQDKLPSGRTFCAVFAETWALALPLNTPSGSNTGWCIDSSGVAKEVSFSFAVGGTHLVSAGSARCP